MTINKHFELLGWKVKDKVTGFSGVVTHVGLDLYGCVQAIVSPPITKSNGDQKLQDNSWFDTSRLQKVGNKRIMEVIPQKGDKVVAGNCHMKPLK